MHPKLIQLSVEARPCSLKLGLAIGVGSPSRQVWRRGQVVQTIESRDGRQLSFESSASLVFPLHSNNLRYRKRLCRSPYSGHVRVHHTPLGGGGSTGRRDDQLAVSSEHYI
jgi:hypothetical protein